MANENKLPDGAMKTGPANAPTANAPTANAPKTSAPDAVPVITMTPAELEAKIAKGVQRAILAMTGGNPMGILAQLAAVTNQAASQSADKESQDRMAALQAELDLGVTVRSQKIADAKYPPMPGATKPHEVQLNDKNGHPKLVIHARSAVEARGAYEDICGILSVEEPHTKYRIAVVA